MASQDNNSNMETLQNSKELQDTIQATVQKAIEDLFQSGVFGRGRHGPWSRSGERQLCKQGDGKELGDKSKGKHPGIHRDGKMKHLFHHRPHHHFHHHHSSKGCSSFFKGKGGRHGKSGKHGQFGKHGHRFSFLKCSSHFEKQFPAVEAENEKENDQETNTQVALVDCVRKDLQKLQFNDNVTVIENEWLVLSKD